MTQLGEMTQPARGMTPPGLGATGLSSASVGSKSPGQPATAETAAIPGATDIPLRRLGLSGLFAFPLAISGTVFGWTADDRATTEILDGYAAAGGNLIDTADSYAGGRSEIMIGNWMRDRRNRDSMIVSTKIGKSPDNPGLSGPEVRAAIDASLRRLRSGHIDLLSLHLDDRTVPFEETLLAVDEAIRAGKVRHFGGSNHTAERFIEARIASAQLGVAPMAVLQSKYCLMHRVEYESSLAHAARQLGLGVMPRYALASGFLSGKYRGKADLAAHPRGADAAPYLGRRGTRVLAALDRVAAQLEAPVAAVALAWLLSKPLVVAPVVSARTPQQLAELVRAPSLRLSRHQVAELDRASA